MVLSPFDHNRQFTAGESICGCTVESVLGEGRYGICYRVHRGGERYVLKQLKRRMLRKSGQKARFEEEILEGLSHEGIPRLIKKVEHGRFRGYLLELKEGVPFEDLLHTEGHRFGREEICRIGLGLIGILKYLHSEGIVHRDIRVPNVLYDLHRITLVDFGLARWIDGRKYRVDIDFAYLGDFLLHLCYSNFEPGAEKRRPWYKELILTQQERFFLKRLMGLEERYKSVSDVERDFLDAFGV